MADGLLIVEVDGEWEVWCGADGDNIINAHLIGLDQTRQAAIENALQELNRLTRAIVAEVERTEPEAK